MQLSFSERASTRLKKVQKELLLSEEGTAGARSYAGTQGTLLIALRPTETTESAEFLFICSLPTIVTVKQSCLRGETGVLEEGSAVQYKKYKITFKLTEASKFICRKE